MTLGLGPGRPLGAIFGALGVIQNGSESLVFVTYIEISVILEAPKAPKPFVQSDFGDFAAPESSQTLRV